MPICVKVVVIEREPAFRQALCTWVLSAEDLSLTGVADNEEEGLLITRERDPDVVLLGVVAWTEAGAPRPIGRRYGGKPVLLLGRAGDEPLALEALIDGAAGFLSAEDVSPEMIVRAILALKRGDAVLHPILVGKIIDEIAGQATVAAP